MTITLRNAAATKRQLREDLADLIDDDIDEKATTGLALIKANAPVITGRLRDGWQKSGKGRQTIIFNGVEYAIHVSEGTLHIEPNPYVQDALHDAGFDTVRL